jgi:hypothetical protein
VANIPEKFECFLIPPRRLVELPLHQGDISQKLAQEIGLSSRTQQLVGNLVQEVKTLTELAFRPDMLASSVRQKPGVVQRLRYHEWIT